MKIEIASGTIPPAIRNSKIQWKRRKEGRKLERETTRFLINSIRAKEAGNCTVLFRYVLTRVNNHLPREYIYIYKSAPRICCLTISTHGFTKYPAKDVYNRSKNISANF